MLCASVCLYLAAATLKMHTASLCEVHTKWCVLRALNICRTLHDTHPSLCCTQYALFVAHAGSTYLCGEGFDDSFTVSDNVFGTDDDGDEVVVVVLAFGSVEVDPPFRSRRCFV